jgi:hypothetical protein
MKFSVALLPWYQGTADLSALVTLFADIVHVGDGQRRRAEAKDWTTCGATT